MGDLFACAGDAVTELYGGRLEGGQVVLGPRLDGMDEVLQARRWRGGGVGHRCVVCRCVLVVVANVVEQHVEGDAGDHRSA